MPQLLNLDFSNTPDQELLPSGDYHCKVKQAEYKLSKAGNPMINFQFKVADGEMEGRMLFYTLTIIPQTMWKVKRDFKSFGITNPQFALNYELNPASQKNIVLNDEFYSADFIVSVGEREYENEKQNDVLGLRPFMGGIV